MFTKLKKYLSTLCNWSLYATCSRKKQGEKTCLDCEVYHLCNEVRCCQSCTHCVCLNAGDETQPSKNAVEEDFSDLYNCLQTASGLLVTTQTECWYAPGHICGQCQKKMLQ